MTIQIFSQQLQGLCLAALQGGQMDASQIIGQLEIAKLNVDRVMLARAAQETCCQLAQGMAAQETAKAIVKPQILPLNGGRFPKPPV